MPNEWENSPKVGGLVKPLPRAWDPSVSWLAHSRLTSTLANQSHSCMDAVWCTVIHLPGWVLLEMCAPRLHSLRLSRLPPSSNTHHTQTHFSPFSSTALWLSLSDFSQPLDLSHWLCSFMGFISLCLSKTSRLLELSLVVAAHSLCVRLLSPLPWFILSLVPTFLPPY